MAELRRFWRFPYLVGGPSAGEPVSPAAWHQQSPKGITTTTWHGFQVRGAIPPEMALDVNEYHAVHVNFGGPAGKLVEAFVWDQLAYSSKGIDALETAILDLACTVYPTPSG